MAQNTQIVPHQTNLPALIPPSKRLATHLLRLSDAATDTRYPRRLTREMVIAVQEDEAEIRAALKFYRQQTAPADVDTIMKHLLAMEVVYPSQHLTRDQKNLKYQIYYDSLRDVPAQALARAFEEYVKRPRSDGKPKFFPDPAEIRAIAEESIREANRLRRGIDAMMEAIDNTTPIPEPEPTISPEAARQVLDAYGFKSDDELTKEKQAAEILARPRIPYEETPNDVKVARLEALVRRSMGTY